MAFGDIAKLLASLDLDTRLFQRGAGQVNQSLGKMESGMQRVGVRTIAAGTAIGRGIERIAEKGINVLFDSLQAGEVGLHDLQNAQAQTAAVIESTGGKAGVTAQQIRDLAEAQESLTTVDDKVVQGGENMLLTFTGIGKDVFPRATKAMVNMAIAMNGGKTEGIDLKSTAIQLGKALQDPVKGATALRRVGVALTEGQQKQIKTFIKHGEVAKAQGVILQELEKEFGKAGDAAGKSGAAGIIRLHDAVEDAQIALASGLAPALEEIRGDLAKALENPQTQASLRDLGKFLGDAATNGVEFAKSVPWGQIGEGLKTAAGFAGRLFDTFAHLPPGVQATIIGLAGLNKLSGGGVIKVGVDIAKEGIGKLLGGIFQRGSSPANPMFVTGTGIGGGGGVPTPASGGLGAAGKLFLVGEAIGLIAAVGEVRDSISQGLTNQATDIHGAVTEQINATKPDLAALAQSMAGVDQGINAIQSNPLNVLVGGDALTELQKMRAELGTKITELDPQNQAHFRLGEHTEDPAKHLTPKQLKAQEKAAAEAAKTKAAVDKARDAMETMRIRLASTTQGTTSKVGDLDRTTATGASHIVSAIRTSRPITNITVTVTGTNVKVDKTYSQGDMGRDPGHHTGLGGT